MESRDPNPASSLPGNDWHGRLFQLAPDALLVTRLRDGQIVDMNFRFLEMMGYSREELIGRTPLELGSWVNPEDREVLMNLLREGRGRCSGFETTMRNKQGREIPVLMSARVTEIDGEFYLVSQSREDSERRQIKKALQESEEKFREMVEFLPVMVYETDQEGRLTFANRGVFSFFGYTAEDFEKGLNVLDMIPSEDRERAGKDLLKAMRGEKTGGMEYQALKKDGSRFPALIASAPILRENRPIGIRGVVTDITELRKAEKELRESQELYQTLVEMSNDAITMVKGDIHRYVNPMMIEIFGYERADEIVGHSILQMIHPDDRERVLEINRKRQKGELVSDKYVFKGIRKDGQPIFVETSAKRLHYRGESVSLVFLRDITDRFKAEEDLKASEEKYRLVVENANEAILVIQEGLIQFINPKAVKIMHYAEQELSPQPFLKFIHPEDREKVMEQYLKRMAGEPASPVYSFRLLDHQGNTLWVEITAVQISWEGQPAVLVFLTDITEKKQLEMQFLQAQKMEAVGRLAGGVAHDFNNLLTSILGHSDLMLMRLLSGDPLVGDIKEIIKAANRATDLTRQLLAFSRKQVMQPKILNLNGIISDMKKMLKRLIGEDIILETLLAPNLGRVLVDPGQIDQVIMNLVVNARDAMPKGGTLTIETSNALLDEVQVRSYIGAKPGTYVLLSVKDSGSGMSEELQSHIFEPFFTTKELGKGTGLGLSTVYGIVKQSNGYIWVDSRPGQGTAFKIFLPQQEGEAASDLKLERGKVSLRGEETILLAEDNELVRGLTRSVLELFGYQVLETEDGEEAGRMSKGYEGPIHLLLTDVVMPGISGRVLAEQLQILRPGIKILFMSGYSEEAVLLQGMQNLGAHFLQKPFTPEELGLRVREILDSA